MNDELKEKQRWSHAKSPEALPRRSGAHKTHFGLQQFALNDAGKKTEKKALPDHRNVASYVIFRFGVSTYKKKRKCV